MLRFSRQVLALGGAVILLLFTAGMVVGAYVAQYPDVAEIALQLRSERLALSGLGAQLHAEREALDSQFRQSQRALILERAARHELENNLRQLQSELNQQRDDLAFFQQVFAPGPQGSISLRAIAFDQQPEGLFYRVLLMQNTKVPQRLTGQLQFIALGCSADLSVTDEQRLVLGPLTTAPGGIAAAAHPSALQLDFEQFQQSQGWLSWPKDLTVKAVLVQVIKDDIVLISKRVAL